MEILEFVESKLTGKYRFQLTPSLLKDFFEKYGTIENSFTMERVKIEKILEILSNELYFPLQFKFSNEIVNFNEAAQALKEKFG